MPSLSVPPSNTPGCARRALENSESLVGLRSWPFQQIVTNCTGCTVDDLTVAVLIVWENSKWPSQQQLRKNSDQCNQVKMKPLQCDKCEIEECSLVESREGKDLKREMHDSGLEWKSCRQLCSLEERERLWIGMVYMAAWQRKLTTKVRIVIKAVSVMGYDCVEVQT